MANAYGNSYLRLGSAVDRKKKSAERSFLTKEEGRGSCAKETGAGVPDSGRGKRRKKKNENIG